MRVETFSFDAHLGDLKGNINEWLSEIGDIHISHCVEVKDGLLVFYSKNLDPQTTKSKPQDSFPRVKDEDAPKCPKCGGGMKIASNPNNGDIFWGCQKYPDCRGSRVFENKDWQKHYGVDGPGAKDNGPIDDSDIPF